jgi:SAM-dependent methyltransferase
MATVYDEVRYPSRPFGKTHPRRLGVAAALLGLPYAPTETARVLEIGCGEGGNIVPIAASYPQATVVGFDLAASAIARGQAVADALGLRNIRLRALDILQAGPELGEFDYIIAHGVYSWTPEPVRAALLDLVRACLAPNGLAFVSYNALPGCHIRLMVREMLLRHLRGVEGLERLPAARAFLEFVVAHGSEQDAAAAAVKAECRSMLEKSPEVLFHDELGAIYEPVYFDAFVAAAAQRRLQFVAEADSVWWREALFPSDLGKAIGELAGPGVLDLHQYLDFTVARMFRATLLCREEARLDRSVEPGRVRRLWASAQARRVAAAEDAPGAATFELGERGTVSFTDPELSETLAELGRAYPQALPIAGFADDPKIHQALLQLFTAGLVTLSTGPAPLVVAAGERPVASPVARLQASHPAGDLCALTHEVVRITDEAGRRFLQLLDGSRTRGELAAAMAGGAAGAEAARQVDQSLAQLARLGLLTA